MFVFVEGVAAHLRGTVSTESRPNGTYMKVETLSLALNVKRTRMHISKVFKNNRILSKFLFISKFYWLFY